MDDKLSETRYDFDITPNTELILSSLPITESVSQLKSRGEESSTAMRLEQCLPYSYNRV